MFIKGILWGDLKFKVFFFWGGGIPDMPGFVFVVLYLVVNQSDKILYRG